MTSPLALVTGGAGFVGSHLVDALFVRGFRVRVLDMLAPWLTKQDKPDDRLEAHVEELVSHGLTR